MIQNIKFTAILIIICIFHCGMMINNRMSVVTTTNNFYYCLFTEENKEDLLSLNTEEQIEKYDLYNWMDTLYKNYGFTKFAIYDKDSGEFVGRGGFHIWDTISNKKLIAEDIESFSLNNLLDDGINRENFFEKIEGKPEFGIVLRKEFRGKGFGSKISFELLDWFFNQERFKKYPFIIAGVDRDNIASIKMLEKNFVKVAEIKKSKDHPSGALIYICERERFLSKQSMS